MYPIQAVYPQFVDRDGTPLDGGFVYFGTANANPETSPVTVYFDEAATQPVAQPARTVSGAIQRGGTPAQIWTNADVSITVKDAGGQLVVYIPSTYSFQTELSSPGGSALVGFLQAGSGAVARTAQAKMRDVVSVRDFGALGDGVADDTAAIQAAINRAVALRGVVFIPPANAGAYYKISAPLTVSAPLSILGDNTFGSLLYGVGMSAGAHILDFDCLAANNVENIHISRLTIRSDNGAPNGLRLKNVADVLITEVRLYGVTTGITIEGARCYTHSYKQVVGYQISDASVRFTAGFTGGGQFVFDGCTFTTGSSAGAVVIPTTASVDNLSFTGCNWEQCVGVGVFIGGTCRGISFVGCRTEGGDTHDFNFRPDSASEYIGGINISGCVFSASDNSSADRILFGGSSGTLRGFSVTGNYVTHGSDSYAGKLVQLNGDGESGLIAGNMVRGTTAAGAGVVNAQRAGVVVFSNENLIGKLPEYWGMSSWVVSQTSYTATATGMTTSPTGTVKYSVVGNTVTLDIPSISGTSNSTAFTLTGGPVAIRPAVDKDIFLRITDNGANAVGFARIKTTGVIELYATVAGNVFTASGIKAVTANSISYTLA